jgi:hypothetical protein
MNEADIRELTKQQCVEFLENFAREYVDKWEGITGDSSKSEGWAILQATMARQIAKLIREIARLQGRIESLEADRRDDWYL